MYGMSGLAKKLNIQNCVYSTENCVRYICTECLYLQRNWMSRTAYIKWQIVYIICTEYLDLQKFWIYRTAKIRWEIVYIKYVWNVWLERKIEYPELRKFDGKLCTLYMYGMSGFVAKLNIQNYENLTANFVHYICTECLDLQKNWISRTAKFQWEIVYIIYVRKVWICRKIEYPELRKFKGKLCTLYMYVTSGFSKKLNIQNCENSTENCVHYICTECKILRKIEYQELQKFNGKLCTLYMYEMSGLAKKLNIQSCKNSTENCVCYICTECLD